MTELEDAYHAMLAGCVPQDRSASPRHDSPPPAMAAPDGQRGEATAFPDRTPIITVELQLRPSPPEDARPYWWGLGHLDFWDADHRERVWRGQAAPWNLIGSGPARVEVRPGFGWVVVVTFSHDKAKRILGREGMPAFIEASDA